MNHWFFNCCRSNTNPARFITLAILCGFVVLAEAAGPETEKRSCCQKELPAAAALSDKSIYHLTSSWTNDATAPLQLASLRGRPQIITMFFANCEFACPMLVNDMKRIEAALPEQVRTNVGFVLVSFDSQRDTPAALAKFRALHKLNSNWTLLNGAPDDVQEIAMLLGVKFKKDARGQFAHSNLITLLNPAGEVVTQQAGLNQPGTELIEATKRLSAPTPALQTKL